MEQMTVIRLLMLCVKYMDITRIDDVIPRLMVIFLQKNIITKITIHPTTRMGLIPLTSYSDLTLTRQSICRIDLTRKVDFCRKRRVLSQ